jgi:hypothetical protein
MVERQVEAAHERRGRTMKYLLLIYSNESEYAAHTAEELAAYTAGHVQFRKDIAASGAYLEAQRLQPVSTAKSVRISGGRQLVSDGPFAETKEQLGGFYYIDVETPEEALEWAKRIPQSASTIIEVRPVMEMLTGNPTE